MRRRFFLGAIWISYLPDCYCYSYLAKFASGEQSDVVRDIQSNSGVYGC